MARELQIISYDTGITRQEFWVGEKRGIRLKGKHREVFAARRCEVIQGELKKHHWWEMQITKLGWVPCPSDIAKKLDEAYRRWC